MNPLSRPFASPVKARFTREYFDRIPDCSGLYWFTGTRNQTLFIGKTRNLHKHLLSYRELSTRRCNSYLYELLKQVSNIHWQPIANEVQLHALEKKRIDKEKPLYNRPDPLLRESHIFIGLTWKNNSLAAGIHRSMLELPYSHIYGPFKKPVFTHRAFTALLRTLWSASHLRPLSEAPAPLLRPTSHPFQRIELGAQKALWENHTHSFLMGQSSKLLARFEAKLIKKNEVHLDQFCRLGLTKDIQYLEQFYEAGPEPLNLYRSTEALPLDQIPNEWPHPLF